jgi:uncharacterized protein
MTASPDSGSGWFDRPATWNAVLFIPGHTERYVAVVASMVFALMHNPNVLTGMALTAVAIIVVYTFAVGMCTYLAMRVAGTTWTAIVPHGLTDPRTTLATDGLDEAVADRSGGALAAASAIPAVPILAGFAATSFIRAEHVVSAQPFTTRGAVA